MGPCHLGHLCYWIVVISAIKFLVDSNWSPWLAASSTWNLGRLSLSLQSVASTTSDYCRLHFVGSWLPLLHGTWSLPLRATWSPSLWDLSCLRYVHLYQTGLAQGHTSALLPGRSSSRAHTYTGKYCGYEMESWTYYSKNPTLSKARDSEVH